MSRSFINLRRVLFGVSCAIVFGFGATQALAEPQHEGASSKRCPYPHRPCLCEDGSIQCARLSPDEPCPPC